MKKLVIAGTLVTAVAFSGTVLAQTPPPPPPKEAAKTAQPPAEKKVVTKRAASGDQAGHVAPKDQPRTAEEPAAPGAMSLGTVRIPKAVKADGKELAAGSYTVRLTADEAKPDARGSTEKLERWVEFVKGNTVVAREVVSIVPAAEAKLVQKDAPPPSGGSKIETLKGGDYMRLWINRGGNYYLIHFAI